MFALGTVSTTDCALGLLRKAGESHVTLLTRHVQGDRGEIEPYLIGLSDEDLIDTVTSIYQLRTGAVIWVTTAPYRGVTVTTILGIPRKLMEEFCRDYG